MLLENKNAIVYGAGGSIGGAVARAFASEGARVFLTGRTLAKVEKVAEKIRSAGGAVETAEVDALDERAIDEHADEVAAEAGSIDVSFNLISHGDVFGTPMAEMPLADFERPIVTAVRTKFLTSKAAARHMIRQGSGAILFFGGSGDPDPMHDYLGGTKLLGGTQVAYDAIEAMRRQLSAELGPHGVRLVTLRTDAVPDAIPQFDGREALVEGIEKHTMLGRGPTLEDVGNVAAFVASDRARTMTASTVNVSCGALID